MLAPAPDRRATIPITRRFSELYFGYASNLSPSAIKGRCPDSLFCGLARLENYKWIINSTGYANIIPSPGDHVYGSLVFLSPRDEAGLDESEGVPWLYEKRWVEVERVGEGVSGKVEAMTYVDGQRVEEGVIERDYVVWVRKAMRDGVALGVPGRYVERYLEPWVRGMEEGDERVIEMVRVMTGRGEAVRGRGG